MENSFLKRFIHSCHTYAQSKFFTEAETGKTFTYHQFFQDCRNVSFFLNTNFNESDIVVLLGKNSYCYAVYASAAILSGKTLFPLNPDEDQKILSGFLQVLIGDVVAFADYPEDFSVLKAHPMEFKAGEKVPESFVPDGPAASRAMIYMPTSATTGQSKIVVQTENALLSNIDDLINHHRLRTRKNILTPLPLFHVNALHFSFFSTLFSGGHLIVQKTFEPRNCFEMIEKYKVEIVSLIPVLLMNIIKNSSHLTSFDYSSLNYFVSAAAPLSVEVVEDIRNLFGKKIMQGYGLSEAINFSCTLPVEISDELYRKVMLEEKFPSVGVELRQNEVFIVDESFQKLNEGCVGELAIKGKNLMRGYLNTPKEQSFTEDSFLTGDLGYFKEFDNQRFYFICGRKKEIAKIMGESVSLREMDELLYSKNITQNDFFVVSFDSTFKGEELGIVCKIKRGEESQAFLDFQEKLKGIKSNRRPKVILFVIDHDIRTPSGKAKRSFFKSEFLDFKNKRLLNQVYYKVI